MTNPYTRFPTSCRSQRVLPAVLLTRGLRSASQSLIFVQIFVNAARASASTCADCRCRCPH
jgi:hypothetical protein